MHMGVYLVEFQGKSVPKALWELILKNNSTGFGLASATMEGFAIRDNTPPTVDELIGLRKGNPDKTIVYHFYEGTEPLKMEDVQPFCVLEEGEHKVVAFIDGPLEGFEEVEGHTREHNVAQYLNDKLESSYARAKGDINKFKDIIRTDMFKKELVAVMGADNSVTLLVSDGEMFSFGKIEQFKQNPFEWGYASNYYGFSPAKAQPTQVVEEKPKSGMDKLFNRGQKAVPQTLQTAVTERNEKAGVVPAKDNGPTLADANAAGLGENKVDPAEKVWITWKDEPASQNKMKDWYHHFDSSMSREQMLKKLPIQVTRLQLTKFRNWKIVSAPTGMSALAAVDKTKLKDQAPQHVPQNTPATPVVHGPSDASKVEVIPRVPAEAAKKLAGFLQGAKLMQDPATFKDMEAKYPTILDMSGGVLKNYTDLYRMGFTKIHEMVDGNHVAAVAIMGLAGYAYRLEEKLAAMSKTANEKVPQKIAM